MPYSFSISSTFPNKLLLPVFGICCAILASCGDSSPDATATITDHCSSIHRNDSISLAGELAGLEEKMTEQTGVYVLEDGAGSMVARAWLSEYAAETIDIQYFIFSLDNVGLIACDYLVRAADRGVKIRILVDDILVDAELEDVLTLDAHENISIKIYNPGLNLGKNIFQKIEKLRTDFRSANQRMHNKTFIVDGQVAITGGRNIADEYFDYDHAYNFRDRDVLLLGKETHAISKSFDDFWKDDLSVSVIELTDDETHADTTGISFATLHEYACNPDNFAPEVRQRLEKLPGAFQKLVRSGGLVWVDDVTFVSDIPGKNDGSEGLGGGGVCTDALVDLVQKASTSLDIQSPYLVTTEDMRQLFKAAVDRGVKVRILTNSLASTDNVEAFSAYQKDRAALLETGVRIFEYRPDAAERSRIMTSGLQEDPNHQPIFGLHAKSMVVDSAITVIGTFNLDPRSANLNTECIAIIPSEEISKKVLEGMATEFLPENAWETTLDFNPDSQVSKWKRAKTWTRKILPKEIL